MQLPNFSEISILVIGDLMLDRYWSGTTGRISPEAPVPVIHKSDTDNRLGGAANVALNLAKLEVRTRLCGIIGDDEAGHQIKALLGKNFIHDNSITSKDTPTITKLRVMSRNQQLLRIDTEDSFQTDDCQQLLEKCSNDISMTDAIIFSDYGKGALANPQPLIKAANQKKIPILIDPKGSDFQKYRGATILTPNLSEFQLVVGRCNSDEDIFKKGEALRQELQLTALLITLSEKGVAIIQEGIPAVRIPTVAKEVFDVTGAGDTVIATIAAALGAGLSLIEATKLGNIAAGIVVGKLGTAYTTPDELLVAVKNSESSAITTIEGLLSQEILLQQVQKAKSNGKKIVMTNGCFDLLHPGHIQYLQEAATLGDMLVVAINDDASISRLKGDNRPINTLVDRATMLAALKSVAWVTTFSEDTPANIIKAVVPDVLVKGGDYTAENIVGYDTVTNSGGEVKILSFAEGYSSSKLIKKIQSFD